MRDRLQLYPWDAKQTARSGFCLLLPARPGAGLSRRAGPGLTAETASRQHRKLARKPECLAQSNRNRGSFAYEKRCASGPELVRADVYMIEVTRLLESWPEQHERQRAWFTREDAANVVSDQE